MSSGGRRPLKGEMCRDAMGPTANWSLAEDVYPEGAPEVLERRELTLRLDGFVGETIEREASRLGVSAKKLVTFAVLYYLADVDSGRIARQIPPSPYQDST